MIQSICILVYIYYTYTYIYTHIYMYIYDSTFSCDLFGSLYLMNDLCYRSNELSTHTSHFAFRALYNIGSYIDSNTIKGYIFNYIIARIERLNQSDLNGKRPQHIRQWHSGSLISGMCNVLQLRV